MCETATRSEADRVALEIGAAAAASSGGPVVVRYDKIFGRLVRNGIGTTLAHVAAEAALPAATASGDVLGYRALVDPAAIVRRTLALAGGKRAAGMKMLRCAVGFAF